MRHFFSMGTAKDAGALPYCEQANYIELARSIHTPFRIKIRMQKRIHRYMAILAMDL